MPAEFVGQPDDADLRQCSKTYRSSIVQDPWKTFRSDPDCGSRALRHLHSAYGPRCIYCDHAHGRTIDHVLSKTASPNKRFSWANWRPSCMDCNNLKGTKRVIDPVRTDPRKHIVFDLATGEPFVVATGRMKATAETTRKLLHNQTLNEARRATRLEMVRALENLVANDGPKQQKAVLALLSRSKPHRAILRELILERDDALNPDRAMVDAALAKMPHLEDWAKKPR